MASVRQPNIIYIYGDDLGRGMLSCYGQRHFRTPHIDRLAAEGVMFENYYGCSYCAPARASLLTGRHDCHAGAWTVTRGGIYKALSTGTTSYDDIRELINKTGIQAGPDELFLPQLLQRAGYVTGQIGKLEWGFATTPERLARHGWDYHFGYYDHQRCHGFYPPFLFRNGERVDIPGNTRADCGVLPLRNSPQRAAIRDDRTGKAIYSQDIFDKELLTFLRQHKDERFFLWHPTQLPHGPTSIPTIHPDVADNPDLTEFEKEYASMVLRLDQTVGLILDELDALGIADKTLVFFSSDNGHEIYYEQPGRTMGVGYDGGHDLQGNLIDQINTKFYSDTCGDVFDGNDGMAGLKRCNLEGGVRVPAIMRWPGRIAAGSCTEQVCANYDFLATIADLLGTSCPDSKDGRSYLQAVCGGQGSRPAPDYVVFASFHGPALVMADGWKLRYVAMDGSFQLYYLPDDYPELHNLAARYPEKVAALREILIRECDGDLKYGHARIQQVAYEV